MSIDNIFNGEEPNLSTLEEASQYELNLQNEKNYMINRARGQSAFTLIELLTSISIISLLIAITLPALSGAREAAKITKCMSNARQVDLSTSAYTNDFKGAIPKNALSSRADRYLQGNATNMHSWAPILVYATDGKTGTELVNSAKAQVFYCPNEPEFSEGIPYHNENFGLNAFKNTTLNNPSVISYFVIGNEMNFDWKRFMESTSNSSWFMDRRKAHKEQGSTIAYVDGHVKFKDVGEIAPTNPYDAENSLKTFTLANQNP